jgi:hypothetical protein
MQDFTTIHLFNSPPDREADLRTFIEASVVPRSRALRRLKTIDLFRCSPLQLQAEARQPWTYAAFYESASGNAAIDLPALAPVIAELRDAGFVDPDGAERIFSYKMYHPWKHSTNLGPGPLTHIMFLLANFVPGHEAEYHHWYDTVHSVEVSESPGFVGMRRGKLSEVQVPPRNFCPGSELILGGLQTDALETTLMEFYDRAVGRSPSGIAWADRNSSASLARTVHIFERVSGWSSDRVMP